MKNQDLIQALEAVPEKKLRLVKLAQQLLGPGGEIDLDECSTPPLSDEISAAVEEARAYGEQTRELTCSLDQLLRS